MRKSIWNLTMAIVLPIILSSCTARLVDFTVISSKNVNIGFKKSEGKKVIGKSIGFLGIGATIKDAIDKALESAGPDYDLLVDGVVKEASYFLAAGYIVEGIAINSSIKKAELGSEEAFQKWCLEHKVLKLDEQ